MAMAMAMASSSYCVCVLILCASVTFHYPLSSYAQLFFIFGDSLYDPGNNQYIPNIGYIPSNYSPYGTTFFNHSTGRFSDGRVVPDFIAARLNFDNFVPPALDPEAEFINGANFASAGAGVFPDTDTQSMSFGGQIDRFLNLTEKWRYELSSEETNAALMRAVYLISIGTDDYFAFSSKHPHANETENKRFVDFLLANFTSLVKKIYEIGGRKFMIQNVAPMGCLPMMKQKYNLSGDACAGKLLTLAELHNAALPNAIRELQSKLTGFKYSIFDYYTALGKRIDNPAAYGFKVGDVACCGAGSHRGKDCGQADVNFELCFDPNEYLFFDGAHNTDKANSQMAGLMWSGQEDVVAPFNMRMLAHLEPVMKSDFLKKCSIK